MDLFLNPKKESKTCRMSVKKVVNSPFSTNIFFLQTVDNSKSRNENF